MKTVKTVGLAASVLLMLSATVGAPRASQTRASQTRASQTRASQKAEGRRSQTPSGETVLFAVKRYEQHTPIDPIVIVRRGAYVAPPVDEGGHKSAAARRFIDDYFKRGRRFRMLFGGGEAGSLTVVNYNEPACVGMTAETKAQTDVRLGGEVQALATNSTTLGKRPPSRRAPTESERNAALELARSAYARRGVGPALVKKMEVINLTATDLDRDGRVELIGGFKVDAPIFTTHALFIIFEPSGAGFRAAHTWFNTGSEETYMDRRLVDQIDLDDDGTAEVVAETRYYESLNYVIYKKVGGRWREVYEGGGGGC